MSTSIVTRSNRLSSLAEVRAVPGLVLYKTKSGAQRLQPQKKKDFIEAFKAEHPELPGKQAVRAFEQYLLKARTDYRIATGTAMIAGHLVPDRINFDVSGDARNISLVRNKRVKEDELANAAAIVANATGRPVEDIVKEMKAHGATIDVEDVKDIDVGEVAGMSNENVAPAAGAAAPGSTQPTSVAAA